MEPTWSCPTCATANADSLNCKSCGTLDPRCVQPGPIDQGTWTCLNCTIRNQGHALACHMCYAPRGTPGMTPQTSPTQPCELCGSATLDSRPCVSCHFDSLDLHEDVVGGPGYESLESKPPTKAALCWPQQDIRHARPIDAALSRSDDVVDAMWSDEETQDTTATTKMTKSQLAYEAFYRNPFLMAIKTGDLRLALKGPKLPPSHDKAHYFDVEVAKYVVVHAVQRAHRQGQPAPNYVQDIVPIKRALRHPANWRPLLATKNRPGDGIERQAAAAAMQKEEAVVRGHQFSKLVSAWRHIQNTLADNVLFEDFKSAYATVSNEYGVSVIHAAAQRDAIQIADASIDMATSDAFEAHVLWLFEKDGTLYRKADGTVDERCQAVRSGQVKFNGDGSMDKRCSAYRSVDLSFRSATKGLEGVSPPALASLKHLVRLGDMAFTQSGAVDKRCKAVVSGRVVVTEVGQIDTLSPVVTGVPPTRGSNASSTNTQSPGRTRQDGQPDLRYGAMDKTSKGTSHSTSTRQLSTRQQESPPPVRKVGHPDTNEQARPALSSPPPPPPRNDGQPDLRYRSTQPAAAPAIPDQNQPPNSTPPGRLRNDGQPDRRFAANHVNATGATATSRQSSQDGSSASASTSSGRMKADGTPDMRFKENRR
ncbi:Aste57867_1064 [Aphanomyces stellatus]|uniref:Aste57867_1064 protein n=1 Tax=Aphanomyces stellatus TaxID=120398 RepID=A0A485K6W6_9STRA|nr:hypothetical protein As57867_001063 [Aphanomyces stellatus]VFT78286.1 Aste57867_1064 [Aphanomyces stellatus]